MGFKRPASVSRRGQSTRKPSCFAQLSQSASTAFELQSTWIAMNIEFLCRASKRLPRRTTVSLDQVASRADFQRFPYGPERCGVETLTVVTRGRKNARQALIPPLSVRRPKNKSPLSCNFKCHPQAPLFRGYRRTGPLTFAPARCELQAPEAILGQLHRGAKGVAVVTRLFHPDLEPGFAWSFRTCWKLFKP